MTVHPDDVGILVRSAADGDKTAWSALVEHFSGLVWSIARAHRLGAADAEEVFQITWLRFTENVSRLRDPDRVGAWLATTARNESLKVIRLGARVTATDSPQVLDRASEEGSPETAVLAAEEDADRLRRARQLWSAFEQLQRPLPAAAADAHRLAPAELRRHRRHAGHRDRQHWAHPGPLPGPAPAAAGRLRGGRERGASVTPTSGGRRNHAGRR